MAILMISAASYPPSQKTRGQGTHSFKSGKKKASFESPGHPSTPNIPLSSSGPKTPETCSYPDILWQPWASPAASKHPEGAPFWQPRYYDFNVWSEAKRTDKLRYIHRNPVKRGLVERPEDWLWSSFRHYATGADGPVEIESQWTARRRERLGMVLTIPVQESQNPRPLAQNARRAGHPQE